MSDQHRREPDARGASERKQREPGARTYGRAIDCAARGVPADPPIVSGHGRGAPQPGTMDGHILRG
jgi:hypothetical protein